MKNNRIVKSDKVELSNNPVRDLSLVETFTRQNTACRRYATTLTKQESCMPNGMPKQCGIYTSTKLLSLRDIGALLVGMKPERFGKVEQLKRISN